MLSIFPFVFSFYYYYLIFLSLFCFFYAQVLCSTWKDDGMTVFSGGCDKQVKMWPLMSGGQPMTVAVHDAPISEMAWIPEMSLLVTGSWDKTLKSVKYCISIRINCLYATETDFHLFINE